MANGKRPDAVSATESNRREALLRAAARLFVEKGFDATTTRDIAEAVGMRSGSPFYHFRSKHDLLKAAIADGEAALAGRGRLVIRASGTEPLIRVMAEGDDATQVEEVVDSICDAVRKAVS